MTINNKCKQDAMVLLIFKFKEEDENSREGLGMLEKQEMSVLVCISLKCYLGDSNIFVSSLFWIPVNKSQCLRIPWMVFSLQS